MTKVKDKQTEHHRISNHSWTTICETVCPILPAHCLSVCDIGVLWPNGWIDQDETWHAGRPRTRPHCVRGRPSSPTERGRAQPPPLSKFMGTAFACVHITAADVYCGQTAGWIKMPFGTEAGLGPGHIARWRPSSPPQKRGISAQFSAHVYCDQTPG